jgi:glycosyltransferase involved in cell wall biosynthesis
MRVLFVTNGNVHYFGVAEVFRGVIPELATLGVDVVAYSSHETAGQPGPSRGLFPIIHGPLPEPAFFGGGPAVRQLVDVCREERIDLIHSHHVYRGGHAARLAWRAAGIPYVITSHHDLSPRNSRRMSRWLPRRRCRAVLRDAAALTHLNQVVAEPVFDLLDVRTKSRIIPNGIDLAWWQQPACSQQARAGPNHPYVLGIGRFVPDKGFDVVMKAVAALYRQGLAIALVLAGDGAQRQALEKLAGELGLGLCDNLDGLERGPAGRVCFAGLVSGPAKRALFQGSRALVFPSQLNAPEAMPVVLLEALAAGKAIVASDIPTARSVLADGKYGTLVAPADIAAWTEALARLLSNDAARIAQENANRERGQQLGWAPIAKQYLAVYREVLGDGVGRH